MRILDCCTRKLLPCEPKSLHEEGRLGGQNAADLLIPRQLRRSALVYKVSSAKQSSVQKTTSVVERITESCVDQPSNASPKPTLHWTSLISLSQMFVTVCNHRSQLYQGVMGLAPLRHAVSGKCFALFWRMSASERLYEAHRASLRFRGESLRYCFPDAFSASMLVKKPKV